MKNNSEKRILRACLVSSIYLSTHNKNVLVIVISISRKHEITDIECRQTLLDLCFIVLITIKTIIKRNSMSTKVVVIYKRPHECKKSNKTKQYSTCKICLIEVSKI